MQRFEDQEPMSHHIAMIEFCQVFCAAKPLWCSKNLPNHRLALSTRMPFCSPKRRQTPLLGANIGKRPSKTFYMKPQLKSRGHLGGASRLQYFWQTVIVIANDAHFSRLGCICSMITNAQCTVDCQTAATASLYRSRARCPI